MAENHVLIVEDEAKIAELLRHYLVTASFLVAIVERADLAIAEVWKNKPALVLLHIMLPGMDSIGIQPPDFDQIFSIFQRVASSPDRPGTGAGLAKCKRIVEHHGRRIWVESEPGKNSTSFLTISDPKVREN
jgi:light-regulated signal transduction histidine kinase (bacteriophytochrome)